MLILAAIDQRNMKVPAYCYGPLFAVTIAGINFAFGINAGGVLNPARDISARIMAVSVGFSSKTVFSFQDM
jgi:glycerol uptake facilitator-like aquaporin